MRNMSHICETFLHFLNLPKYHGYHGTYVFTTLAMADAKKGLGMFSKVVVVATLLSKVYKLVEDYKGLYNLEDKPRNLVGEVLDSRVQCSDLVQHRAVRMNKTLTML